ncbi:MAG: lamin tail domain-containing protein [Acholeplasmataceae bacterium]|nr:lamin tail domain-containing protein [Acholeplasmataceae bacterium]
MRKKIMSFLFVFMIAFVVVACNKENQEIRLPVLNGLTKTEIITELNALNATYEFVDEINFNIVENTFIRYGNNLSAGMTINPSETTLLIYISVHKILLPDLAGKTEAQVAIALSNLNLTYNITYRDTLDVEEGKFIEYGGTFYIGQELQPESRVAVVIAKYPESYRSPIFISKYVANADNDKALELYNSLDVEVSLAGYKLTFYLDGAENPSNTYTFPEGTTLAAHDTLLLVHPEASFILKNKADILTDELTFIGKDYIRLLDYKDSFIDEFGLYKVYVMNFANRIMVRKETVIQSNLEFTRDEWDLYYKDYYEILDSHPTYFPETFGFLPEDLALPGGYDVPRGMVEVTYIRSHDGDTSYFEPGFMDDKRVRYVGINTPEVGEPYADAATVFLDQLLRNATKVYIQHDPYAGVHDTYNRQLGLVWADNRLANYEIVLNGFSRNFYVDPDEHFIYNGVTLNEWFRRAEASAIAQRLGIWA